MDIFETEEYYNTRYNVLTSKKLAGSDAYPTSCASSSSAS